MLRLDLRSAIKLSDWGMNTLVFRKLEQDVPGFNKLAEKYATLENSTPDLCGAKLMGRWKSGRHFSRSLQILPSVKDRLTSDERCSNYPL